MCFFEVFCALCRSDKSCCCCLKVRKSLKAIYLLDLLEAALFATLAYFYMTKRHTITLVPWVVILAGNCFCVFLRLFGAMVRCCGALRLWTRHFFYCTRLWALIFMFLFLAA